MLRYGPLLFLLTNACQEPTTSHSKIVGGSIVDGTSDFQQYVVKVNSCTAVRIEDDLVLTAAHCIQPLNVVTDAQAGQSYETYFFRVHPNYQFPGSGLHADDIALVYAPNFTGKFLELAPTDRELIKGMDVDLYGVGQSDFDDQGALKPSDGLLRKVTTQIDRIDQNAHTIYYESSSGLGSACFGDSGGPMVIESGSTPQVVGIAAGHDTNSEVPACTRVGVYADLRQNAAWIEQSSQEIKATVNRSCKPDKLNAACTSVLGAVSSSQIVQQCADLKDIFGPLTMDVPISGCQLRVHGDIIIASGEKPDLSLNLSSITDVRKIQAQGLQNLESLDIFLQQTHVESLLIKENPQLKAVTISAPSSLNSIDISKNIKLQKLQIKKLQKASRIVLQSNPVLQELDFRELEQAQYLEITDMKALSSMKGFGNLSQVQNLQIRYNSVLQDFTGLDSLTQITGKLLVFRNSGLTSLTGLESLNSVENIEFRSNAIFHSSSFLNKQGLTIREIVKSTFYIEEGHGS